MSDTAQIMSVIEHRTLLRLVEQRQLELEERMASLTGETKESAEKQRLVLQELSHKLLNRTIYFV